MSVFSAPSDNRHLADIDRRSAHSATRGVVVNLWHISRGYFGLQLWTTTDIRTLTGLPSPVMGWMKAERSNAADTKLSPQSSSHEKRPESDGNEHAVFHIENTSLIPRLSIQHLQLLPFAHQDTPESALPFLPASQLAFLANGHNNTSAGPLYIVIDDIVYDCTQFVHDHPGGHRVIESFRGQECSWQFWRFHSRDNLNEWGHLLRVARTEGVKNRWKEKPRFVGLRKFGAAAEDDW
jgi:cytochrome b involved in lipid metabolism